jgi:hypothetical protein
MPDAESHALLDNGAAASGAGRGRATNAGLRTPRAAAVAGIVFSVLLILVLTLLKLSIPRNLAQYGAWITNPTRRRALEVALHLVPFAGIAFLWFIGVVRDRIGEREDRFFATVFLGSGLLFIAMLFAAAAVSDGIVTAATSGGPPHPDVIESSRSMSSTLLNVYAMRMAAVFTIATASITLRTQAIPRWIAMVGLAVGLVLLVTLGISHWVELLFPAWILLVSVEILRVSLKAPGGRIAPQTS